MDLDIFSLECLIKNTFYSSSLALVFPLTLPVLYDRFFFMSRKVKPIFQFCHSLLSQSAHSRSGSEYPLHPTFPHELSDPPHRGPHTRYKTGQVESHLWVRSHLLAMRNKLDANAIGEHHDVYGNEVSYCPNWVSVSSISARRGQGCPSSIPLLLESVDLCVEPFFQNSQVVFGGGLVTV